ncbi:response regulator [Glaciecola petra]|uniref:Response regulator n=1 Tax=Glaciecola petra TaxID=3075602 RepID=A0ABU2ZS06_9ALTE|nr:response regulator [Aestuariibacter sp. P117]MDT0595411.1 response regulator [Aestuariibacter sp. P117]
MTDPKKKGDVVLVVEDDLISREIHSRLLTEIGFKNVVQAIDGMRALTVIKEQIAQDNKIILVLCDWNMPNMSGLQLLEIIRKDPTLKHIPFFLISSNRNKAHIVKAIKTGVTNYLVKPISESKLSDKLKKYL